jgi:hypothetical protein
MSGFGKWYEEKKNEELGDSSGASSSWLGGTVDQVLPLFNTENFPQLQPISWETMKSSMEQQMPKKILGMGYQQRFQVRYSFFKSYGSENLSFIISLLGFSFLRLGR